MASVSKRTWTYKGEKRTAWVVRYLDEGTHRSKQFETKKEGDGYLRRITRDMEDGVHLATSSERTVLVVAEDFLKVQEIRWRDGRIGQGWFKNVRQTFYVSIIPHLGPKVISDLTARDVEDWYATMVTAGGLKPTTASDRVKVFGQLCEHAIRNGWLKVNPVVAARKQLRGIKQEPITTFMPQEVAALMKAAEIRPKGKQWHTWAVTRAFAHLAAFCGLRYGEIAGLTVPNIDFDRREIRVRHSLTHWDQLKVPKTPSGVRNVPMPEHVVEMLRRWLEQGYIPNPRQLVFRVRVSRTDQGPGGMIHPGTFHASYWQPLLREAGLENVEDRYHFHALRHFAASWMIANGMPIMDTARLLGHRKFDMTLAVYAHPIVADTGRAAVFDTMATKLLSGPNPARPVAQEIDAQGNWNAQPLRTGS